MKHWSQCRLALLLAGEIRTLILFCLKRASLRTLSRPHGELEILVMLSAKTATNGVLAAVSGLGHSWAACL